MAFTATDVLAGPIVRRVDAERACVWIALSKPATAVRLEVFRGQGKREDLGAPLPRREAEPDDPPHLENRTIRIGERLHVALATFEPRSPQRLDWGTVYCYDLRLTPADGGDEVGLGSGGLDLLRDREVPGIEPNTSHRNLALGYAEGFLPSFVVPPPDVKELRLAHGSCRRQAITQRDAMALLDALIDDARLDPSKRIHQLILTGDQIYADAVSPDQLRMLSPLANRLISGDPQRTIERIEIAVDGTTARFPVDMRTLPASRRSHPMNDIGGGSSTEVDSHLIGFAEAAALYVTMWSNVVWPDLKPMLDERWELVQDYRNASRELLAKAKGRPDWPKPDDKEARKHSAELLQRIRMYEAWRLLPAELREIDRHLSDDDRKNAWLPPDDPPPAKKAEPFAWETFFAGLPEAAPPRVPSPEGPDPQVGEDFAPHLSALARALTPSWFAGSKHYGARVSFDPEKPDDPGSILGDTGRNDILRLKWFYDDLPKVRRAMANVATYMLFDDHEVTDDWNINRTWARRVYGSTLGRAMVRNMLGAYALFQAWGNDPEAFRGNTANHRVLEQLQRLFFSNGVLLPSGPMPAVESELDRLMDLGGPDAPRTPPDERARWDFRYRGSRHEILALDSRTWRGWEVEGDPELGQPVGNDASAPLMTDEAVRLQIPADPDPATEVTIVVAPAPFLGMPVVEGIVQPALNAIDSMPNPDTRPFNRLERTYRVGRLNKDPEPFGFSPRLFELVLARLANRRRVVFISGDVHYSTTLAMSYWRMAVGAAPEPTRFVQLISSSLRNPRGQGDMELFTMDLVQVLGGLSSSQARFGWKQPGAGLEIIPGGADRMSFRVRRLLKEDPVLLPPDAIPAETPIVSPEWAWRMEQVPDARREAQRLDGLTPPDAPVPGAAPGAMMIDLARRHRWMSENVPPRRWMWWTNVGVVEFDGPEEARVVRHRLFSYDLDGQPRRPRDRMTVEASLVVGSETPPAFTPAPPDA
jgi:hypothetical protein